MLFSTTSTQIWLLGPSIGALWSDQLGLADSGSVEQKLPSLLSADSWVSFQQLLSTRFEVCRSRVLLIADASTLTHQDIFGISRMREQYHWFVPAIYFDKPDLGKVIHAFDSDLAGYFAWSDSPSEIATLMQHLAQGKLSYSMGFCNLLRSYGFPIDETYLINR